MEALTSQGIPANSCEEAFAAVLAVPGAAESTDEVVRSIKITGVTVDGQAATIDWTAQAQGQPQATSSSLTPWTASGCCWRPPPELPGEVRSTGRVARPWPATPRTRSVESVQPMTAVVVASSGPS